MMEIREIIEDVPCGKCVTTQHWDDGVLVRQDIEIRVKEGVFAQGEVKLIGD